MNTSPFKNQGHRPFKMLTGVAILGGALYGFTLSPAFSQPTPSATPDKSELRPVQGQAKVDPEGRLLAPPADGPEEDAPPPPPAEGRDTDRGPLVPRDDKGPRDGKGERRPPVGPRGERDMRGPGGPGRPDGLREGRGPEGGPEGRGPEGGPEGRGPEGGPRDQRGPQGAMEHAYRGAGELERYGQLRGDVFNLAGQARDYYNRAGVAFKEGNQDQAQQLARTSEQLIQAALHLARAENGHAAAIKVVGWNAPPAPEAPAPPAGEDRREPRLAEDLARRLKDVSTTPANSSWIETARRLSVQAEEDLKAKRLDAGRERAMAAMNLLDAADAPGRPQL